jgi:type I restriction enzyme S subunit
MTKQEIQFKITEIGMIPEDWEVKKVNQVTDQIFSGGTPNTRKSEYWDGNIPWLSSGETSNTFIFETERKITELGVKNSSTRLAKAGDIVVASAGQGYTRGQVSFCMIDTYVNQSVVVLRANKEMLEPLFLFYNLVSRYNELRRISDAHSSRGSLTTKLLADLNIQIPPIREQTAIAKILSDLDLKIALNRSMKSTLEAIGQALFKHWFVDFEFPNEEGKPYKSSGGEMVETELGEVPRRWVVKPFSEVIDVNPNRKLVKDRHAKKVGMADLNAWQSWVESWQLEEYKSGPRFQNGDTLFARITPSLEHGKTAFVSFLDKDEVAFGSTEFIIFAPKIIQSNLYIFHLARSEYVREAAIGAMTGSSGRQRVPEDLFIQFLICVPPQKIIEKFHKPMSLLFEKIANNANQTRNLSKIREALLPKLMSGELRVNL